MLQAVGDDDLFDELFGPDVIDVDAEVAPVMPEVPEADVAPVMPEDPERFDLVNLYMFWGPSAVAKFWSSRKVVALGSSSSEKSSTEDFSMEDSSMEGSSKEY